MQTLMMLGAVVVVLLVLALRKGRQFSEAVRALPDDELEQEVFWSIQNGDFPNAYTRERNRRAQAARISEA